MANYFILKIHSCSEIVTNVDYLDVDYSTADFFNIPKVISITDTNVNVFVSNLTITSARLNFSSKYTGTVKYTATSMR